MRFGIVMQPVPPIWQVVDYARRAEIEGFDHFWTFDSHLLWQEPNVIFSQVLSSTHRITVGPMVTNPATRHPSVTASTFATLNTMFGNRTACGLGRGDSAVRVTKGKPVPVAELRAAVTTISDLANGRSTRVGDSMVHLAWAPDSRLPVYVGAYGPKMLELTGQVADGLILQIADPHVVAWSIGRVKEAAAAAGRDPEALEAVAVMLGQLLDAVVLVKTLGALPRECIAAVFDHGYELHRWRAGHLPDSAVRAAHYSMWRMIEVTKDRAWLESAALGMLDRETLSSLLWMAFRVSGYITVRNSGTDAPVWVRMYHASILARFGVAAAQVRQVEP